MAAREPLIDVGGGAAADVDGLLRAGHSQLTVLDLSAEALAVARARLGAAAAGVRWVVADVTQAALPPAGFALWHDRAVFHFLTAAEDRALTSVDSAKTETVRRLVARICRTDWMASWEMLNGSSSGAQRAV